MKKNISLSLLLILVVGVYFSFATEELNSISVKVVVLKNFPPQYSISETGKPQGFSIDIIEEIAKIANLKIEYLIKNNWSEIFEAVKDGHADLIPNQGITDRRKQWFSFSRPVETFPVSIFIRKHNNEISTIQSLAGKKVAVIKLNIGEVLVANEPNIIVQKYDHVEDALFSLFSGNVDALIFPEPVLWKIVRDAGMADEVKVAGAPIIEILRAISVAKNNSNLLKRINTAIEKFIPSDNYNKIYTRWYGQPEPYWTIKKVMIGMTIFLVVVIILMGFWRYQSTLHLNYKLREHVKKLSIAERQLQKAHETLEEKVEEKTHDLKEALSQVKTLTGLIPICAHCKKIRDDKGCWNQIEGYIQEHSEASFSHSMCTECSDELYGKEDWYIEMKNEENPKE